jgi:hypothetical protein
MILNAKTAAEVGYLLVNVLQFWHSTIDCTSFGLFSEVSLVLSMLTPFWLLASLHWWWRWRLLPRCVLRLGLLGCSFCYFLLFLDGDMAHPGGVALVLTIE